MATDSLDIEWEEQWAGGEAWEQERHAGGNLLPWSVSVGSAVASPGEEFLVPDKLRKCMDSVEPKPRGPQGPPSNLASRVMLRNASQDYAEEVGSVVVGQYHLCTDEKIEVRQPNEAQDASYCLLARKVDYLPRKAPQGFQQRLSQPRGSVSSNIAGDPILQHSGVGTQAPPSVRLHLGEKDTGTEQTLAASPREQALPSRTWLQDAQDRSFHSRDAEHQESKASKSPMQAVANVKDQYALGQKRLVPVPVGICVQPIVLERLQEKEKEREREIERGAIVQGSAMVLRSPALSTPVRGDSRLRALLRQSRGRQEQRTGATSMPSDPETLHLAHSSSTTASAGRERREQGQSQRTTTQTATRREYDVLAQQQKLVLRGTPSMEEPSSKNFSQNGNMPATLIPAISVSFLHATVEKQEKVYSDKRSTVLAPRLQIDPFSTVRLEEQRQQRLQMSTRQPAQSSATIVAKTAIATTQKQTNIPPHSLLRGSALCLPASTLPNAGVGSGHAVQQGQTIGFMLDRTNDSENKQRAHMDAEVAESDQGGDSAVAVYSECQTSHDLWSVSPVRLVSSSKAHIEDFPFLSAEKAGMELRMQRPHSPHRTTESDMRSMPAAGRCTVVQESTATPQHHTGCKEEALLVEKVDPAVVERCHRGFLSCSLYSIFLWKSAVFIAWLQRCVRM